MPRPRISVNEFLERLSESKDFGSTRSLDDAGSELLKYTVVELRSFKDKCKLSRHVGEKPKKKRDFVSTLLKWLSTASHEEISAACSGASSDGKLDSLYALDCENPSLNLPLKEWLKRGKENSE